MGAQPRSVMPPWWWSDGLRWGGAAAGEILRGSWDIAIVGITLPLVLVWELLPNAALQTLRW